MQKHRKVITIQPNQAVVILPPSPKGSDKHDLQDSINTYTVSGILQSLQENFRPEEKPHLSNEFLGFQPPRTVDVNSDDHEPAVLIHHYYYYSSTEILLHSTVLCDLIHSFARGKFFGWA